MKGYNYALSLLAGLNYLSHSCPVIYQISQSWLYVICLTPKAAGLRTYEPSLSILALVFLVTFGKEGSMFENWNNKYLLTDKDQCVNNQKFLRPYFSTWEILPGLCLMRCPSLLRKFWWLNISLYASFFRLLLS